MQHEIMVTLNDGEAVRELAKVYGEVTQSLVIIQCNVQKKITAIEVRGRDSRVRISPNGTHGFKFEMIEKFDSSKHSTKHETQKDGGSNV